MNLLTKILITFFIWIVFGAAGAMSQVSPTPGKPWPYGPMVIDTSTIPAKVCIGQPAASGNACPNSKGVVGTWDGTNWVPIFAGGTPVSGSSTSWISLTSYGADPTGTNDSVPAMNLAIAAVNSSYSSGPPVCIYIPKGTYLFNSNPSTFTGPGCVIGDGPLKTIVKTGPNLTTSVFSWTDAWIGAPGTAFPYNGATVNISAIRAGPILTNLSIVGNRGYAQQTAIAFDGHEDFGLIQNVDVFYMNGSAFRTGVPAPGAADAYTRETRLVNFRAFNSGKAGAPVIDIGTLYNGGETSNSIDLLNIDVYAPFGAGIHLAPRVRYIEGTQIRVEGIENNPSGIQSDLIQVGDAGSAFPPVAVHFKGLTLIDPYVGFAALHLAGSDSTNAYDYDFEGSIGGGNPLGNGLQLDVGRQGFIRFAANNVSGKELILGAAVGTLTLEAGNNQSGWTITNNSAYTTNSFFSGNGGSINTATGANSFSFGSGSTANGPNSVTIGLNNTTGFTGNVILGGTGADSRGRNGWIGSGASPFFQFGKMGVFATVANASEVPLRGISGYGPCITTDNTTHGFRVNVTARDVTNPTNVFYWTVAGGLLTRDVGASTTRIVNTGYTSGGLGNGASASARVGADTQGACIYVAFTPPSGNTDTWHVAGTVETIEIQ
jgi:hypothetical protein